MDNKLNSLEPPIQYKNFMGKAEVLYIEDKINDIFTISFIDTRHHRQSEYFYVPVKELPDLLGSRRCKNVKAAVFNIANMESEIELESLSFRQMVYEQLSKLSCHIYFTDPQKFMFTSMLMDSNIQSNAEEVVLAVAIMSSKIYLCEHLRKPEFCFHTKHDGYSLQCIRDVIWLNRSLDDVKAEILGSWVPNKVIITDLTNDNDALVRDLKFHLFPDAILTQFVDHPCLFIPKFLNAWTNPRYWNYKVFSLSFDTIAVSNDPEFVDPRKALIFVNQPNDVPYKRNKVVSKSNDSYYGAFLTSGKYEVVVKAKPIKEKCHRIKLVLSVNRNALPFLNLYPFNLREIEALPQKLASQNDLNIPVIGFYDNSSVICVRDKNGYKFLNSWNGLYGNDLYLSFEKEEAVIITDVNKVKDNDPFLVYDLIRILLMHPKYISVDPKWGFKVTSNAKNPVLFEYDDHNGSRKSSTPISLMVLLLQLHLHVIKYETNSMPTKLGFQLFYNVDTRRSDRINNVLEEACKLLNIGFVTFDHF